jgi:hypothetical protein
MCTTLPIHRKLPIAVPRKLEPAGFIGRCEPYSGRRDPRRSVGGDRTEAKTLTPAAPRSGFRPVGGRARHRALRRCRWLRAACPGCWTGWRIFRSCSCRQADLEERFQPSRRSRVVSIPPGAFGEPRSRRGTITGICPPTEVDHARRYPAHRGTRQLTEEVPLSGVCPCAAVCQPAIGTEANRHSPFSASSASSA